MEKWIATMSEGSSIRRHKTRIKCRPWDKEGIAAKKVKDAEEKKGDRNDEGWKEGGDK